MDSSGLEIGCSLSLLRPVSRTQITSSHHMPHPQLPFLLAGEKAGDLGIHSLEAPGSRAELWSSSGSRGWNVPPAFLCPPL